MRILGLAGLFILAAMTPSWAADCSLKKLADLPLTVNSMNVIMPVKFGTQDEQLAFQLQNSMNMLPEDFVKEQDLTIQNESTDALTTNGVTIRGSAVVPIMSMGPIPIKDVHFMMLPAGKATTGTVGSLGGGFLGKVDFELDLAHQRLALFLPDHCPGQVVYWAPSDKVTTMPYAEEGIAAIRIDMKLDGKNVRAAFTTNGISAMGMNAAQDIFGLNADSPGMVAVDLPQSMKFNAEQKIYRYAFKALSVGGITIQNPNILIYSEEKNGRSDCSNYHKSSNAVATFGAPGTTLIPRSDRCYGEYDFQLGLSVLTKLRLYFSKKENLIYATAADAQ